MLSVAFFLGHPVWISRQLLTYTNGIYGGKDEDDYKVHGLDDMKMRVYIQIKVFKSQIHMIIMPMSNMQKSLFVYNLLFLNDKCANTTILSVLMRI